jgi:hypothetical protein
MQMLCCAPSLAKVGCGLVEREESTSVLRYQFLGPDHRLALDGRPAIAYG